MQMLVFGSKNILLIFIANIYFFKSDFQTCMYIYHPIRDILENVTSLPSHIRLRTMKNYFFNCRKVLESLKKVSCFEGMKWQLLDMAWHHYCRQDNDEKLR